MEIGWKRFKLAALVVLSATFAVGTHWATAVEPTSAHAGDPFNHDTWLVASRDGKHVDPREARMVLHHASVPDVCVDADGRVLLYYVDASGKFQGPGSYKMSVRIMDQRGELGAPQRVEIAGEQRIGVDPDAILLADGRIRLYYLAPRRRNESGELLPSEVRSALSTDGVHFVREPGVRHSGVGVMDPAVIQRADGTWKMYVAVVDEKGQPSIASATSKDGLTFTADPGLRLEGAGSPGAMALPDGRVRLYTGGGRQGLVTRISTDGLTFEPEGLTAQGQETLDPSIAERPDGTFLLAFKTFKPGVVVRHDPGPGPGRKKG